MIRNLRPAPAPGICTLPFFKLKTIAQDNNSTQAQRRAQHSTLPRLPVGDLDCSIRPADPVDSTFPAADLVDHIHIVVVVLAIDRREGLDSSLDSVGSLERRANCRIVRRRRMLVEGPGGLGRAEAPRGFDISGCRPS